MRGGSITARLRFLPAPRACLRWIGTLNKMPRSCKLTIDQLVEAVLEGCIELGLELASPKSAEERGGSVMFRLPSSADPAAVVAGLREQKVFVDCRGTTLRVSPGNVTTWMASIDC